jgi:hypothetical protein
MTRTTSFCAALVALVLCAPAPARAGNAVFFEIDVEPHREVFVVKLRDPETIAHARALLAGGSDLATHVMGRIRRKPVAWNPDWSWRLGPRSVEFFEAAIEVCDASISYVEEHLDEVGGAFLPGRVWCPWGSRLLREIPRP